MVRKFLGILILLTGVPLILGSGLYLYRSGKERVADDRLELQKQVDFTAAALEEFILERVNDASLWTQTNTARVALDFQRPESLTDFLTRTASKAGVYERILVLNRDFEFFSTNQNQSSDFALDDLIRIVPKFADLARQIESSEPQVFWGNQASDLYIVSAIKDPYEVSLGYFIAKVENSRIARYFQRVTSLSTQSWKNIRTQISPDKNIRGSSDAEFSYCKSFEVADSLRYLCAEADQVIVSSTFARNFLVLLFGLGVLLLLFGFYARSIIIEALAPIEKIIEVFRVASQGIPVNIERLSPYPEIQRLEQGAEQVVATIETYRKASEEAAVGLATGKVAKQVAHDIRSPLAALQVSISSLENLPEDLRRIIQSATQRIAQIANELVNNAYTPNYQDYDFGIPLVPAIKTLIAEKQIQCRYERSIRISLLTEHPIYVQVDPGKMNRMLSNIIDNAIDATQKNDQIEIQVGQESGFIKISVIDLGKGIPKDILPQLGKQGATFGKPGGSGLGLYFAMEYVKKCHGRIEIQSTESKGSQVDIFLPSAPAPDCYLLEVDSREIDEFIVVDDDESVHQAWRFHLANYLKSPHIQHFYSPAEFEEFFTQQSSKNQRRLFLVDYEFRTSSKNGLQLIEEYDLFSSAILVTANSHSPEIIESCLKRNLKILPKSSISETPIIASPEASAGKASPHQRDRESPKAEG